jgi:hypothetical protein
MFLLNTILAWNINIIMNKKYDNNNIIIASRAYFLHKVGMLMTTSGGERNMDCILEEIQPRGSIRKYIGLPVCFVGPTTNVTPINVGQNNVGPCMNYLGKI